MTREQSDTVIQTPIQRWLVLTEFGVELQPTGQRGVADEFAEVISPYRRRCTVVTETAYHNARGNGSFLGERVEDYV